MKNIIVYATKYGCTEKAAKILDSKLGGRTLLVNIMKEPAPALEAYDTIILGGSIYMGKIQKELLSVVDKHMDLLLKKKIGLFICAGSPDVEARKKELETVFPSILYEHAVTKELFGYEINYEKLRFLDKMIMKAVSGGKSSMSELSEAKITDFAKAILAIDK